MSLTLIHCDRSAPVSVIDTGIETAKPVCVQDYNTFLGVIDLSDLMLKSYGAMRKPRIW